MKLTREISLISALVATVFLLPLFSRAAPHVAGAATTAAHVELKRVPNDGIQPQVAVDMRTALVLQSAGREPTPLADRSNWNLLVEGGKGAFWTSANCHPMEYFAGSPLHFDFEQDFFGTKQADLRVTNDLEHLGAADSRIVVQVVQRVHDTHWDSDMVIKRLLVQRTDSEFCAIYQQIYAAAQVNVKPARLLILDGKPVLKTLDQNGNATWNEEYWMFTKEGPLHLDLTSIYTLLNSVLPKGDRVAAGPFDLSGICHKALVLKPTGDCAACGSVDGFVLAKLTLQYAHLTAAWMHWFPSGSSATCANE